MKNTKHKIIPSPRGTKQSLLYKRKAILWIILGFAVLVTVPTALFIFRPKTKPETTDNQQTIESDSSLQVTKQPSTETTQAPVVKPLPSSYDIFVPYAAQAPYSNWTVHEESCEEAALYMYKTYFDGVVYLGNRIPESELDTAFRAMKQWQVTNYGNEPDLTMTTLGEFARSYYGYTPIVKKEITAEDIKKAVADGHPVIVPVMTHSLQNNMYGPETTYHVLFIKGYDTTGVITNDAGVGNGANHHYTWEILWQAIDAQTPEMGVGREMLYLTK